MSQNAKARWKLVLNIVTTLGLIILIYGIRKHIWQSFRDTSHIRAWLLPLIIVWQGLNYDAYARQNRGLLKILGEEVDYKFLYRVNLELNFINHILPSGGVSGFSYFSMRMKDRNVSGSKSSLVQLVRWILIFVSFQVMLFIALFMLSFSGHVNRLVILTGGSLSTLILVGTAVIAFVIGSKQRINSFFGFLTKMLNRLIHIVRPKHPQTINVARAEGAFERLHENYLLIKNDYSALKWPFIWSLVANLTEFMTLYTVYIAFGHWVNPGAVILAFAVANFAGLLSELPAGIGIYETLMTAILAVGGVPAALSIPVTIMYRVMSMIVQIIPGYVLYYRHTHSTKEVV